MKESRSPGYHDSDWDDNNNLEMPNASEMLNAINMCKLYITAKICREIALNSSISL